MGKLTMQLARFMTNECGWTLQGGVCDTGYVHGHREQQLKLKAPHPLNLVAPLVMIELWNGEGQGCIEVNGANSQDIFEKLSGFFTTKWQANLEEADPDYCNLKFECKNFDCHGWDLENNMGQLTMELVDFMVKECQWTMVTCNGGGLGSMHQQQLIFRNDEFVQHGADRIMVELWTAGYIEINGLHNAGDMKEHLIDFIVQQWGCKEYKTYFLGSGKKCCDLKYTCPKGFYYQKDLANNLGKRTLELANCLGQHGWALMLCNGASCEPFRMSKPETLREQQVKFTKSPDKAAAPLLLVEFRTQPYSDAPPQWHSYIEICGLDTNGVYDKLHYFISEYMGGKMCETPKHCDRMYQFDGLRCIHPTYWGIDGALQSS